ncbi:hypothetical protein ACFPL7_11500 [Dongia soli]|uniref:Uncharacterized protein n=1 Tax=Dongia soli TaxID=600628 RepID=A0ABU5EBD2_9PROT|nr:hypothetical protein [Dongia soli]MDY0883574.1 hypothetical protein [Dongia soli]
MGFYVFKLDQIHVKNNRGKIPDTDLVTFSVFVDQVDRGHGTGTFPGLGPSAHSTPANAVRPNNKANMDNDWDIGPLEIDPGSSVHVVYTATNISDAELTSLTRKQQDEIELKLLGAIATAAIAALSGGSSLAGEGIAAAVGKGVAAALGAITDPVAWFIGYAPQGPCNGPVFSDAVQFNGSGLDNLAMAPLPLNPHITPRRPQYFLISFTRSYTDEATHDKQICGDIAETDVTFSILRMSFISVRWALNDRLPARFPAEIGAGLRHYADRQYGQPPATISVKSLLGLRP